jgi:adenylate kinase
MVAAGRFKPQTDTLVLDGIPRNVAQAKMLDPYIEVVKLVVLSVDRDREEVVRRLKLRASKENRLDDAKEEVVRRRLEVYDKETAPLLSHYPAKLHVTVDALQTPIEVAHDIISGLLGRTQELRAVKA